MNGIHLESIQIVKHVLRRSGLEVVLINELKNFLGILAVTADFYNFFVCFGQISIDDADNIIHTDSLLVVEVDHLLVLVVVELEKVVAVHP